MIELKVADYCHNCGEFEPKKVNYCAYMFDELFHHDIKVVCEHRDHCEYLRRKWELEMFEKKGAINEQV